jgi:hypothetical protein
MPGRDTTGRGKGIAKLPRKRGTKNRTVGNMLGVSIGAEPFPVESGARGRGGGRGKRPRGTMPVRVGVRHRARKAT